MTSNFLLVLLLRGGVCFSSPWIWGSPGTGFNSPEGGERKAVWLLRLQLLHACSTPSWIPVAMLWETQAMYRGHMEEILEARVDSLKLNCQLPAHEWAILYASGQLGLQMTAAPAKTTLEQNCPIDLSESQIMRDNQKLWSWFYIHRDIYSSMINILS